MLQYTPSSVSNALVPTGVSPDTATVDVGPQQPVECFSFNLYGIRLGCDSKEACTFTFTGFKYGVSEVATEKVIIAPCPKTQQCDLGAVKFSKFNNITAFTITSYVNGKPAIWWADDLSLGWTENICDMRICRSRLPDSPWKRGWTVTGRQAASRLMSLMGIRRW
jgi:hypothetical protein